MNTRFGEWPGRGQEPAPPQPSCFGEPESFVGDSLHCVKCHFYPPCAAAIDVKTKAPLAKGVSEEASKDANSDTSAPACFGDPGAFAGARVGCLECDLYPACGAEVNRKQQQVKQAVASAQATPREADKDAPPSKYHRLLKRKLEDGTVIRIWIDVYDVLDLFVVTNPADQHALKKMLAPGKRGHKDEKTDRDEAAWSLRRAAELEEHRNA